MNKNKNERTIVQMITGYMVGGCYDLSEVAKLKPFKDKITPEVLKEVQTKIVRCSRCRIWAYRDESSFKDGEICDWCKRFVTLYKPFSYENPVKQLSQ